MKEIPVFQSDGFEKKKWVNMFFYLQHSNNFQKLRREMKNTILLYEHYKYHRYKKS